MASYQCFGGPMDGAVVSSEHVYKGVLDRSIKGELQTVSHGQFSIQAMFYNWNLAGSMSVRYDLVNGRLMFVGSR